MAADVERRRLPKPAVRDALECPREQAVAALEAAHEAVSAGALLRFERLRTDEDVFRDVS